MTEHLVHVGDRAIAVRDFGAADGEPVLHFHGTPGSRLEMDFGSDIARRRGVRVVAFDRPGYGRSDPGPIDAVQVAEDVEAILDRLRIDRVALSAWSGGGAFALATAARMPERVTRVGVAGGVAPILELPGGAQSLTPNDLEALSHLPADPPRAAELFFSGNKDTLDAMVSVMDDDAAPWIDWMWQDSDPQVVADEEARRALLVSFREALRQGALAIAWDNVAFVGPWGFRLDDVTVPVHLWYGSEDQMAPRSHGEWLAAHLPLATLRIYEGEGHLLPLRHWDEMLRTLTSEA